MEPPQKCRLGLISTSEIAGAHTVEQCAGQSAECCIIDPCLVRYFLARSSDSALDSVSSGSENRAAAGGLLDEFLAMPCGRWASAAQAATGAEYELVNDPPKDGGLVAANIPGVGKLLRVLRVVGGAALLCDPIGDKPAIPVGDDLLPPLRKIRPSGAQL